MLALSWMALSWMLALSWVALSECAGYGNVWARWECASLEYASPELGGSVLALSWVGVC